MASLSKLTYHFKRYKDENYRLVCPPARMEGASSLPITQPGIRDQLQAGARVDPQVYAPIDRRPRPNNPATCPHKNTCKSGSNYYVIKERCRQCNTMLIDRKRTPEEMAELNKK